MIKDWLKSPKIKKIAVGALVLGNTVRFLGTIEPISRFIFAKLGFRPLEFIDQNMRFIVIIMLLIGYLFAFYFIYRKYIARHEITKKVTYGAALVLVIMGVFALNIYALPNPPNPLDLLPKETKKWNDVVFKSQAPNGGFLIQAMNPSTPTQVYTTAQCLKAILTSQTDIDEHKQQIRSAFQYIEQARHNIATVPAQADEGQTKPAILDQPEEGWGYFEASKKTVTEVAGWVTVAYVASVESKTKIWSDAELPGILDRIQRDLTHIKERQDVSSGGWRPIKDDHPGFTRTYSTVIALWSMIEARRSKVVSQHIGNQYDESISKGITWLLQQHGTELGWVPNPNRANQTERYDGLNALVLFILSRAEDNFGFFRQDIHYLEAKKDFVKDKDLANKAICSNARVHDADLALPPVDFELEGSTLLWFPWAFAELVYLSNDTSLSDDERNAALRLRQNILRSNIDEINRFVDTEYMYVVAEHLFCLSEGLNQAHART